MNSTTVKNNDIEIKFEDQKRINQFSRVYQKSKACTLELKKLDEIKKKLEDCEEELEMTEEESIPYNFLECYITVPTETAIDLLSKEIKMAENEMEEKSEARAIYKKDIDRLKIELYAKFGDNINLEE